MIEEELPVLPELLNSSRSLVLVASNKGLTVSVLSLEPESLILSLMLVTISFPLSGLGKVLVLERSSGLGQ